MALLKPAVLHIIRNLRADSGAPLVIRSIVLGVKNVDQLILGMLFSRGADRSPSAGMASSHEKFVATCALPFRDDMPTWLSRSSYSLSGAVARVLRKTFVLRARMALRGVNIGVIHVHFLEGIEEVLALAVSMKCPCIITLHLMYSPSANARAFEAIRRVSDAGEVKVYIVLVSFAQRPLVERELLHIPIEVIKNGVNLEHFSTLDGSVNLDPCTTFCCVARLTLEKGHDVLLEAFSCLLKAGVNARLLVVGAGPELANLVGLAERLRVSDLVEFCGFQEDVRPFLARANVFVLPSRTEAYPLAAIEALCVGLPIVGTEVGGMAEIVGEGCGRLVSPDNKEELAEAMKEFTSAERRARARIEIAKRRHLFGVEEMCRMYSDLYSRAMLGT